jgi:hypothetical protein
MQKKPIAHDLYDALLHCNNMHNAKISIRPYRTACIILQGPTIIDISGGHILHNSCRIFLERK